ncbi:MAG: hypothetical protein Q9227_007069 [Pyrenula ochraceoflavens]
MLDPDAPEQNLCQNTSDALLCSREANGAQVVLIIPTIHFFDVLINADRGNGLDELEWIRRLQQRLPNTTADLQKLSQSDLFNIAQIKGLCSLVTGKSSRSGGNYSLYMERDSGKLLAVLSVGKHVLRLDRLTGGKDSLEIDFTELCVQAFQVLASKYPDDACNEAVHLICEFGFTQLGNNCVEEVYDTADSLAARWEVLQHLYGGISGADDATLKAFGSWFADKVDELIIDDDAYTLHDGHALASIVLSESDFKHGDYRTSDVLPDVGPANALKTLSGLHEKIFSLLRSLASQTDLVLAFLKKLGSKTPQDATKGDDKLSAHQFLFANVLFAWCQKLRIGDVAPLPSKEDLSSLTQLCLRHDTNGLENLWGVIADESSRTNANRLKEILSYIKEMLCLAQENQQLERLLQNGNGRSVCVANLECFIQNTMNSQPSQPTTWAREVPVEMSDCLRAGGKKNRFGHLYNPCRGGCPEVAGFIKSKDLATKQFKMDQSARSHVINKLAGTAFNAEPVKTVKPHQLKVSKTNKDYECAFEVWERRIRSGRATIDKIRDSNENLMREVLGDRYEDIVAFKIKEDCEDAALKERDFNTLAGHSDGTTSAGKKRKAEEVQPDTMRASKRPMVIDLT